MKILYIITKSNFGGAQKYVYELAKAASSVGHEVSVACGGTGDVAGAKTGALVSKLEEININVLPITSFMRDMSPLNDIKAFFYIWSLLRKNRPEVLHVTSSKAGGIGALAGRLAGVPKIIFTSHGLTVDEMWRPRWQRALIYFSTWITLRLAHQSIMINTETYHRAQSMPGLSKRITLIMNGIAPVEFINRETAREKLAPTLAKESFWIGGIGELHPNKNWAAAISAMTTLPKSTHLFIIGEGEERKKLEALILKLDLSNQVHLLGYLNGAPFLSAFDIFVLPSLKEGLPYVILEAGLAGLATIASNLPGNQDIIETGENGLLIEPNVHHLAATLEMLMQKESMREKFGLELKRTVLEKFSIDSMYKDTLALYESNISS